jgi:transcriptional regulator with XRE-family HTH domain
MSQYLSYSFKDHDPVIDKMRTIISDENVSYKDVHVKSGVSANTLRQWFSGKTKRPQHCTIMAVTRSLGYEMTFTKDSKVLNFKRVVRRKAA